MKTITIDGKQVTVDDINATLRKAGGKWTFEPVQSVDKLFGGHKVVKVQLFVQHKPTVPQPH